MTDAAIDFCIGNADYRHPLVALSDLITVNPGRISVDLGPHDEVGYVTPSNLTPGITCVTAMPCSMTAIPAKALECREGDLLVSRQLTKLQAGKVALAPATATPTFCSPELYVIRVDHKWLDVNYFLHFLRQPELANLIATFLKNETGIHPPVAAFFSHVLMSLPPINTQRSIVADAKDAQQSKAAYRWSGVTMHSRRLLAFDRERGQDRGCAA